jgi:hypothetical protein
VQAPEIQAKSVRGRPDRWSFAVVKWGSIIGERMNTRKLATLVDLPLEVTLFVEEILKTEMSLVHVLPCFGGRLFVGAGGGIGVPVQGLETSEECAGAYVNYS